MPTRLDTIRTLAEQDPYFRGYLDGLGDTRGLLEPQEAPSPVPTLAQRKDTP